ncbi:DUF6443 domain-containing protein [Aquimarina megaterium]|uniref:DUF6443 domain-containing protein n=1 Tax=Aquimarina megaterium TaxID=1443666 RepID=UPI000A4F9787|nr:DUF6443 domain-containing protein [Aquimarina megaterium]
MTTKQIYICTIAMFIGFIGVAQFGGGDGLLFRDADADGYGNPNLTIFDDGGNHPGYVTNGDDCNDSDPLINPNKAWYIDNDGDGWGSNSVAKRQCYKPSGNYVDKSGDCNDSNASIRPRTFYRDNDGDGYGVSSGVITSCSSASNPPSGYANNPDDCNDTNGSLHPNTRWSYDGDGDGWGGNDIYYIGCSRPNEPKYAEYILQGGDCNDGNAAIHPNTVWYKNSDGDGFASDKKIQCTNPGSGYSLTVKPLGDCNDNNASIHPNTVWYKNSDGDGFASNKKTQCTNPGSGYSLTVRPLGDCNDNDASIHPNTIWYADSDGDTWGDKNITKQQCTQPSGYVTNDDDYDDTTINITNIQPQYFYNDADNDGFGDPNDGVYYSVQPSGYILNNQDRCPGVYGERLGCIITPHLLTLSDENYVFTRVYQEEMSSPSQIKYNKEVIESVTYFDGLGRPLQQRSIAVSPDENDIVTHVAYDDYGRQDKQYLPFETNTTVGSYKDVNVNADINSYYKTTYADDFVGIDANHNDFNAYSESIFEKSPLNRVLEQGAPGKAWKANSNSDNDHTIKFDWGTNIANEVVYFRVNFANPGNTEDPNLVQDGFYTPNKLYITITKDENWTPADGNLHTTREYKDKQGRIVLKRTFASTSSAIPSTSSATPEAHDTYYVYDDFGNLTYVIPPKVIVADGVSDTELAELCYQYKYDNRNRLIEKKIPGKDWEYIVYNKLDQPILTQDASLRQENSGKPWDQWLFTKYDAFGRVVYTGSIINGSTRKVLQGRANASTDPQYETKSTTSISIAGTPTYYSLDAYPDRGLYKVYTINYYDDYTFDIAGLTNPGTVYNEAITDRTKPLATGSKVRVLDTNDWITTVTYYDKKARPIYVASTNEYLNTTDIVATQLDFVGKVEETTTRHKKGNNTEIVTIDTFTYDHMGRIRTQTQKINDQAVETIVENTYDALGQLERKETGGGLQEVDYKYNVRGWLTKINDPDIALGNKLFAFGINYNTTTENLGATALYNGNISETTWKTANDNTKRGYGYQYDALNRIASAINTDANSLAGVSYDKNGNITSLKRKGSAFDLLTYNYSHNEVGNTLLKVTDAGDKTKGFIDGNTTGDDYAYDANGNMTMDQNKGITSITYNHLNLPKTVTVNNTSHNGNITYIYDATGVKLKKITTEGSSLITEYAGNYVYKNGILEFFNHPEGIVEKEADGYKYVYQFKDHLQNLRLSYSDKNKDGTISQDEIIQEKNYYPFGMTHSGYNNTLRGRNHNYGFGNKEEQDELSLEWLDFGARNYDASLGRWMNLDPLAEQMRRHSPYNYAFDNPIRFIDPDGMAPEDIVINTKDPTTDEYIETLRIISDKIDTTINLDVPTPLNVNPVTNSGNMEPIVLNGLDDYLDTFEEIFGKTDAVVISLSAGFAGGGGLGGQLDIVGFLNGDDAGGAFLYGNSDPTVNAGLGLGASIEVGGIYDRGDLSDFNRDTFENNTTKALSGGHGVVGASVFMGTYGTFDFNPNYIGFTTTLGVSPPTGVKYGGMLSVTKSSLKETLVEPKKK